jgi:hypothetical protein
MNANASKLHVGVLLNHDLVNGVTYQYGTQENKTKITADHYEVEPLCFPFFFPYGERGWGADLKASKIHLTAYLAARMLQPENIEKVRNEVGDKLISLNRFQLMSRLGQYFLVEGVSRSLDSGLKYQRANRNLIFGYDDIYAPVDTEREVDDDSSSTSFLSDSVMG